jgi:hypothetical protein
MENHDHQEGTEREELLPRCPPATRPKPHKLEELLTPVRLPHCDRNKQDTPDNAHRSRRLAHCAGERWQHNRRRARDDGGHSHAPGRDPPTFWLRRSQQSPRHKGHGQRSHLRQTIPICTTPEEAGGTGLSGLDEHGCGVNDGGNSRQHREHGEAQARVGAESKERSAGRMEGHQNHSCHQTNERPGERFDSPADEAGDAEGEKADGRLLNTGDLALRRPELNHKPDRNDDGAQCEEAEVDDRVGVVVLIQEPQPDGEGGDADKCKAKEQGQDRRPD